MGHNGTHAPRQPARDPGVIERQSGCLCPVPSVGNYWGICMRFLRPQRPAFRIAGEGARGR
jgi:hypothetical protein